MDQLHILPLDSTSLQKKFSSQKLCKTDAAMAAREQKIQEDWFASWILELIRIAKPGAYVLIETTDSPICSENQFTWGGVDKSWFTSAVMTYDFDVDIDSFVFADEKPPRYNTMFRKKTNS